MKRIGFITKNKVLAQSLVFLIKNTPDIPMEPYVFHSYKQAVIDAEVFEINIAVIEMIIETNDENHEETGTTLSLCNDLRKTTPNCQILLLVQQDNKDNQNTAMKAVNDKIVDDYIFTDTSLDYLLAKLLAL